MGNGLKPCTPGPQGLTPLMMAAKQGNAEVMRALIEAKADQEMGPFNRNTAIELLLHAIAVKQGNAAHILTMSGADVNIRNVVRLSEQG